MPFHHRVTANTVARPATLDSERDTDAPGSRRRVRRRLERRYHQGASPGAAGAPPDDAREADRVERLAYTRTQAAEALGITRSTFNRRVLPYVDIADMPWGTMLVPVDELERLLAERRRRGLLRPQPPALGRPPATAPELIARIQPDR